MGKRDYGRREPKKVKKDARKSPAINVLKTPANVEVIRKERMNKEIEEAER
jgi:hypothetical protein